MNIHFLTFEALPTSKAATTKKVGGLNTIVFHLSESLADSLGHNVNISCCKQSNDQTMLEILTKVKISSISPKKPIQSQVNLEETLVGYAEELRLRSSEYGDGLIHTCGSEAGYVMALARKMGLRIPWVHTNYATLAVRRVFVQGLTIDQALSDEIARREMLSLKQCDHVVALSEVDKEETCEVFGIDKSKITAIPPGVDHSVFNLGEKHSREHWVITAGRMSKVKDFPFLIKAFRLALDTLPAATMPKLIIIGGNAAEREELGLPQFAKSMGLFQHLNFYDGMEQAELAKFFQQAWVFAGCSQHETFGLLPVEARACGTPWVVRANSSYLTTATDGYGGYFADNHSEQDMANKIAEILSLSDNQWNKMSMAANASTKQYNWPKTAQNHTAVYQNIVRRSIFEKL
jgi:glycosyltransferase involved in cell wall biosynthesis